MKAVTGGDIHAFEVLYDRYSSLVFAVCLRVLRHPADAEDALIETFWALWRKPDRFDSKRGGLVTYLAMLARCRSIDLRRSRIGRIRSVSSHEVRSLDTLTERLVASRDSEPVDEWLVDEQRQIVRSALRALSAAQREAIELAFYEGLSHREIAARLRIPLGTIKTRIRSGLMQLRNALQGRGADTPSKLVLTNMSLSEVARAQTEES